MPDVMTDPRAHHIRTRLDRHFIVDVGVPVATPEPAIWWSESRGLGHLAILGWTWPLNHPDHGGAVVTYCPEIIDEQTGDMPEERFDAYLQLIEYILDSHMGDLWEEIDDPEIRHGMIEEALEEDYPGSLVLLREMQAAASFRYL